MRDVPEPDVTPSPEPERNRRGGLLRRLLPAGGFRQQVARVAGGTAMGQGVLILLSPVLTRVYDPDAFGMLAAYLALVAVGGVVGSLRYQMAIVLPDDEDDAAAILGISLFTPLVVAAIVAMVLIFAGDAATRLINAEALRPYWWVVPIGVVLLAYQWAWISYSTRLRRFVTIGKAKASEGVFKALSQLALGVATALGPLGLLIGDLLARVISVMALAWGVRGDVAARLRRVPRSAYGRLARRYRDFPLYAAPGVLLNTLGLQAPALLLAALYDLEVAGIFALGQRVIAVPLVLVADATAQVYLGEGARLARENPRQLLSMYRRATIHLFLLGVLPFGLVAIAGEPMFAFVFGDRWIEAGTYARILSGTFALQFVAQSLSHTLNILERQRWQLAWDATRLVLVVGALWGAAASGWSGQGAVAALAVAGAIAYVMVQIMGWVAIKQRVQAHEAKQGGNE